MTEFITKVDCQYNKERCYETNIRPLMDEMKEIKEIVQEVRINTAKFGERIRPLEKIVYGMVGIILSGVLGALIYLILKVQ